MKMVKQTLDVITGYTVMCIPNVTKRRHIFKIPIQFKQCLFIRNVILYTYTSIRVNSMKHEIRGKMRGKTIWSVFNRKGFRPLSIIYTFK